MNLQGTVERVTFRNDDNGYTILKLNQRRNQMSFLGEVTVTGNFEPAPQEQEELVLVGDWVKHPKYGDQFKVERVQQRKIAQTPNALAAYLASGLFPGIGPVKADALVLHFGMDLDDVITRTPERLAEVKGITTDKALEIAEAWKAQAAARDIMTWLCGFGLTTNMAVRIYKRYGSGTTAKVSENPYRLAVDVDGIGFLKADDIARLVFGEAFKVDMPFRIRAGLVHSLREARTNGHVYLPYEELVREAVRLLGVRPDAIRAVLDGMPDLEEKPIVIDDQHETKPVYLTRLYDAERLAAHQLKLIANNKGRLDGLNEDGKLASEIAKAEVDLGFTLTDQQRAAVRMALSSKVSIITGGPGVGKSTILKMVVDVLRANDHSFDLCSPTGRAAKRLSETTHCAASTIHRLLGFTPDGGFQRNAESPLGEDMVIVDEMSMVDMSLFNHLMQAVPVTTHVLFVGDADQLPSVGAGDVLHELIKSRQFPVATLTNIFRQGQNSNIITNAHAINHGQMPDLGTHDDWRFAECDSQEAIQKAIVDTVVKQLPALGYSPVKDVQVLLPMYKGEAGVNKLNTMLRDLLNPAKTGGIERKFRVGDKVMQLKNNYELGVFNGDVGYVTDFDLVENEMIADIDGRAVRYPLGGLDQLTLAYACTIHKSQGSEYPVVIVGMSSAHYIMLKRNLLYTGITRGKQRVILVGDKKAIGMAVKKADTAVRFTRLAERLT